MGTDKLVKRVKKVSAIIEKRLLFTFYRYLVYLKRKIELKGKDLPYEEEYFVKWRPFSKEKYYIIRVQYSVYAHFAAAQNFIFAAEYVKDKGMIPIIVLQWQKDIEKRDLCGESAWDTVFYQQKIQKILDKNATILVSRINAFNHLYLPETCIDINNDPTDLRIHATEIQWRNYYKNIHEYIKKYWKFNREIIEGTKQKYAELFKKKGSILGVALRETFSEEYYLRITSVDAKRVYRRHPKGPDVSEILDIVAEHVKRWNCDKIFVASIFDDSIKRFTERFPGKVVYCERKRMTFAESIESLNSRKKMFEDSNTGDDLQQRYNTNIIAKEYAQETILLSKCTYLIGAKSGQTIAALAMNGGRYKDIKILEDKNHIERY